MNKHNGLKIEVVSRGLDLPKRELPKELKKTGYDFRKLREKRLSEIKKISVGDQLYFYAYKFGNWLMNKGSEFAGKTLRQIIPPYVWFSIIGLVAVVLIIITLVIIF